MKFFQPTNDTNSGGTVTSVSVATANGFAGSVATPSTTPVITLSAPETGILKSNGTAISAATAGTDYLAPSGALTQGSVLFQGASSVTQDNANFFWDDTNFRLGIGTAVPTHSLTFASGFNDVAAYNTADQVTNYERATLSWATTANKFTIQTEKGGTGTLRNLVLGTSGAFNLEIASTGGAAGGYRFSSGTSVANANQVVMNGTYASSSGVTGVLFINPTMTQTSTAGYTAIRMNVIESTVGNGVKLLADLQVGGVSQFSITNTGDVTIVGRELNTQGTVASATNITLGEGNVFAVTGTTAINTIAATGWTAGSKVTLTFSTSVTVTNAGAGTGAAIKLAGSANFSATADDNLTLLYNGTTWNEVSRTVI